MERREETLSFFKMPYIKIAILEKEGEEFGGPVELDLLEALNFINFTGASFDENKILVNHKDEVLNDHNGNVLIGA